jgi:hypothetical protein
MSEVMRTKKTVVLAKVEATYEQDPTPTAADNAVEAYDVELEVSPEMIQRNPGNSDLSMYPELRGATFCSLKFWTPVRGSGTAGTAPKSSGLMKACGLGETVVSSTSVTYAPVSVSMVGVTIWVYIDGICHKVTGCVGTFELDFTAGQMGKISFEFKGVYAIPTDISIVTPTFDTTTPQIVKGCTMTLGSYAAIIEKLSIKQGNKIADRKDFNQAEAYKGFAITGREPEGSVTIEAVLRGATNADFFSYFHSRTVKALSMVLGGTAGNIATLVASYTYLRAPKYVDTDGIRKFELGFQLGRGSSGNDEYSLALT